MQRIVVKSDRLNDAWGGQADVSGHDNASGRAHVEQHQHISIKPDLIGELGADIHRGRGHVGIGQKIRVVAKHKLVPKGVKGMRLF